MNRPVTLIEPGTVQLERLLHVHQVVCKPRGNACLIRVHAFYFACKRDQIWKFASVRFVEIDQDVID